MKKILFILVVAISMASCNTSLTLEATKDGKVIRVHDAHAFTKVGDTIVIGSTNYGYIVYGKYVGTMPAPTFRAGHRVEFETYKRIR